jgi:ketosteroid isomerase-like protein
MDSRRMTIVKEVWDTVAERGLVAAFDRLLLDSHEDVEVQPYSAGDDRVLRGAEEIRAFFRHAEDSGISIRLKPRQFDEEDDRVLVAGSIRVIRPDGSFAETMVRWIYAFRDDQLERLFWEPRAGYWPKSTSRGAGVIPRA